MRNTLPLFVVLASLSLAGCFGDGDEPSPPKETGSTKIGEVIFGGEEPDLNDDFRPYWDPLSGLIPYPNDILGFLSSTDGSLALRDASPFPFTPLVDQLNQLDGFSTTARIQVHSSTRTRVSMSTTALPGSKVKIAATGPGFLSMISHARRNSLPGASPNLLRMAMGTTAASAARGGASSTR